MCEGKGYPQRSYQTLLKCGLLTKLHKQTQILPHSEGDIEISKWTWGQFHGFTGPKLSMPRVQRPFPCWSENTIATKYAKNYQSNSIIISNVLYLKIFFIHQTMQSFVSTLLLAPILDPCSLVYDLSQLVSSPHTPDSQTNHLS